MESPLEEYVRLLLDLHRCMAAGASESDEAESLRDQMDAPWNQLGPRELRLVRGLSADLYPKTRIP
ncbi:MAG: hypothetical protein NTY19_02325 [Planctomycetota bacterium]|nr:hypothetical protein [Planctomycetota bacterium]